MTSGVARAAVREGQAVEERGCVQGEEREKDHKEAAEKERRVMKRAGPLAIL